MNCYAVGIHYSKNLSIRITVQKYAFYYLMKKIIFFPFIGIIGSLAYLSGNGTKISGNIAAQQSMSFTIPEPTEGVEWYASETAHRIVGETAYNSLGDDQDGYLRNNFALEPMSILNDLEIYAGPNGLEGATITKSELNASFLKFLGFAFGNDLTSPWDENSASTYPELYYEDKPMPLIADCETSYLCIGDNGTATFTIVGGATPPIWTFSYPTRIMPSTMCIPPTPPTTPLSYRSAPSSKALPQSSLPAALSVAPSR